jgi:hypothetical protein
MYLILAFHPAGAERNWLQRNAAKYDLVSIEIATERSVWFDERGIL